MASKVKLVQCPLAGKCKVSAGLHCAPHRENTRCEITCCRVERPNDHTRCVPVKPRPARRQL